MGSWLLSTDHSTNRNIRCRDIERGTWNLFKRMRICLKKRRRKRRNKKLKGLEMVKDQDQVPDPNRDLNQNLALDPDPNLDQDQCLGQSRDPYQDLCQGQLAGANLGLEANHAVQANRDQEVTLGVAEADPGAVLKVSGVEQAPSLDPEAAVLDPGVDQLLISFTVLY